MELVQGRTYTREEIREAVGGGDLQSYLPHKAGRVLCGCFKPEINARAPFEVEVGNLPDVIKYARVLVKDGTVIPVFLKQSTGAWRFEGRFRPVSLSESQADLFPAKPRRADAVAVIYLEPTELHEDLGAAADEDVAATEGDRNLAVHLRRERSRSLAEAKRRSARQEHGNLRCEACGLSETGLPVELGEACFEVHHRVPLALLASVHQTRLDDLAILCANCHRMIHRSLPMASVEAFREMRDGTGSLPGS
jgi:hypothetical protein